MDISPRSITSTSATTRARGLDDRIELFVAEVCRERRKTSTSCAGCRTAARTSRSSIVLTSVH
ncbi:hypothetical protein [Streptomyces cucumeris]|uniref:hypothetical protein n=1 Tax=Streptomyces cucumeris TaxID=2962890 RepID=UPI003D720161